MNISSYVISLVVAFNKAVSVLRNWGSGELYIPSTTRSAIFQSFGFDPETTTLMIKWSGVVGFGIGASLITTVGPL